MYLATEKTNFNGQIKYEFKNTFPSGMYTIKMVVKYDKTFVNFCMMVLPNVTEVCLINLESIVNAKNLSNIREIISFWQNLGYLIVYVTRTTNILNSKIRSWLSSMLPLGTVMFNSSYPWIGKFSKKLEHLTTKNVIKIHAAYGTSKELKIFAKFNIPRERIYVIKMKEKKVVVIFYIILNFNIPMGYTQQKHSRLYIVN